ncbi:MAG: PDGLE domain-containing protein [Gaiellaceae bacterium]
MSKMSLRIFVVLALAVAIGLSVAVSPFASSSPDGLEKVAEEKGFLDDGTLHSIQEDSPIPDYAFPGVDNPRVATGLAGFFGTLAVAVIAVGLGWLFHRRRPPVGERGDPAAGAAA